MSDLILNGGAHDAISERAGNVEHNRPVLNSGADRFATNATLRDDEWELIDARVNEEARLRLRVFDRFRSLGLVQPIGIGDVIRTTEYLDGFPNGQIDFDGRTDPQLQKAKYEQTSVAVPIVAQDFEIGFRQLASSNRRGNNLSTDSAALAMRGVAYQMEDLIVNGYDGGTPNGENIDGLVSSTNGLSVSLGTPWDDSGGDPVGDTERMLKSMYNSSFVGPFDLMVPFNWWAALQDDYSTQKGDRTFIERLEAFAEIQSVYPVQALADDTAVLVQTTQDVVDISLAQAPTTWQWQKNQAATRFRVLMIGGPQVKVQFNDSGSAVTGIVTLS